MRSLPILRTQVVMNLRRWSWLASLPRLCSIGGTCCLWHVEPSLCNGGEWYLGLCGNFSPMLPVLSPVSPRHSHQARMGAEDTQGMGVGHDESRAIYVDDFQTIRSASQATDSYCGRYIPLSSSPMT